MAIREGSGACADVESVMENNVRVIKKKFKGDKVHYAAIEAGFLASFDHPNIIKFLVA